MLGYYLSREVNPPSLKTNRVALQQSGRICKERAPHPPSQAPQGVSPSGRLQGHVAGVAALARVCLAAGSWGSCCSCPLGLPPPSPAYSEWVTQAWGVCRTRALGGVQDLLAQPSWLHFHPQCRNGGTASLSHPRICHFSHIESPCRRSGCRQHSSPRDSKGKRLMNVVWGPRGPQEGQECPTESAAP